MVPNAFALPDGLRNLSHPADDARMRAILEALYRSGFQNDAAEISRRWLEALLHIDDSPERTAAAFALGVFFGFSPFLGFHTILGIVFAFLLNLNRVAVLLGSANERRLQEANTNLAAENKAAMTIASYATNVTAFQELDLGRVDAFVSGSLTLAYFLTKSGAKFEIGGMPVPPTTLGALFPKDQVDKAEAVKAAYASLVASGEIKKIVDKWGVAQGTSICGEVKCD